MQQPAGLMRRTFNIFFIPGQILPKTREINLLTLRKTAKFIAYIFLIMSVSPSQADYQEKVGIFTIYADEKDSLIVTQLAGFFEESQSMYSLFFNHFLAKPVKVYLASTTEAYNQFNPPQIPEWSSGVAFVRDRIIVLKPGLYYDPARYKETIFHEMAHIFIADILGETSIPLWFNEGVSMYLSGKSISWGESITIGNALSAGKIIDLNDIENLLSFADTRAQLAYLESFLAIQFLVARHGEEIIVALIKDLDTAGGIDQVFFKHLGYGFIEFEIDWYNDLKKRYRWINLLQFEHLLWISLVVVFFLVYVLIKLRNRRIYKLWDQDELSE